MRLYLALLLFTAGADAATLQVHINRGSERGPLEVSVGARQQMLAASASDAVFELGAGSYTLLVAGREPLQRFAVPFAVAAGDTRRRLEVALPRAGRTRGRVRMAGVPLAGVRVTFSTGAWQMTATTDSKGVIDSALWQRGDYKAVVEGGSLPAPAVVSVPVAETFSIELPNRIVTGRVLDDRGAPLEHALVVLTSEHDGFAPSVTTSTNGKGQFTFAGVSGPRQTLTVTAPGYLYAPDLSFSLPEVDLLHEETVTLTRGYVRPLQLVDSRGEPVRGATVICAANGHVVAKAHGNEQGRVWLPTPADAGSTAFVVGEDGALAIRHFGRAADEASSEVERIVVPAATSSLELVTLTTDGEAIPDIALLMRYNGELVPPEVATELRREAAGWQLATGSDGRAHLEHIPPGVYEFWPYASPAEAQLLVESAVGMAAPINVNVATGENRATVRFRKKS
ncbi:MAG TPA: carboxypeptidase-like regulatory domain-containing protein [Thermoanaerobaculia bacterium]|jgi:hypothetical protein|nr:carboxypeptidase-like regulatory domain-containing protein [Thermoanaerobaculia bacterium]